MLFMGHFMNNDSKQTRDLNVENGLTAMKMFRQDSSGRIN